jgi:hypothetical protein
MKRALVLTAIFASACQTAPVRIFGPARLEVAADPSALNQGRIFTIDGHRAPEGPLLVAPGAKRIEYECPDYVTVDGPMSFVATLESGKSYEFYCVGHIPKIRIKPQ